jgi:hypothetical protein
VDISQRPLIQKLLAIDEYYQQYLDYVDALKTYFSNFENIVSGIANTIRSDVEKDPTAFYTIEQFENSIIESDTDLTMVQNNFGKMGGRPGNGQGDWPDMSGYSFPEGTDKADWPNMNQQMPKDSEDTGNTPPQMPNGSDNTDNNPPQESNGSDNTDNNPPQLPNDSNNTDNNQSQTPSSDSSNRNDFRPDMANGYMKMPGGMGNMISQEAVSIIDYFNQRLEQINSMKD